MANNYNSLVKGSSMRRKLQNSKGYTESPEFLPELGALRRSPLLQLEVNYIPNSLDYIFLYTHIIYNRKTIY